MQDLIEAIELKIQKVEHKIEESKFEFKLANKFSFESQVNAIQKELWARQGHLSDLEVTLADLKKIVDKEI